MLSKSRKTIDKSSMYYSNKTFSGVLRGAGVGMFKKFNKFVIILAQLAKTFHPS